MTNISDVKHAVVHAQNDRSSLGPIETCYSGPEVAVLDAKTTGVVFDRQRFEILVLKSLFCIHKTTGEGCNQYSLLIFVLSTQLCVLKTTDEVWDPWRLVILVQNALFCKQKTQMRAGTHRDRKVRC